MMGVHGNGLTHLLWMNTQNPRSTVIEFFYPGGFAEDYEFTSRALGIKHYGVWDEIPLSKSSFSLLPWKSLIGSWKSSS
jgi:hypothetical protein